MGKLNVLIAQGGGPTTVINASLAGAISAAQQSGKVGKIYGAVEGIQGFLAERFIDLTGLREDELRGLKNTPASALASCRYKVQEEDHKSIVSILKKHRIDCFLYNGGNDSMDTCNRISKLDPNICVYGIPKTIDNDLPVTDHCPGYGSAARYAAVSVRELGLDVRSLPLHVTFIELMGRNAGWLTAAAAFAHELGGTAPDLIYLPERTLIMDSFLNDIETVWKTKHGVVVAVSEGVRGEDGKLLSGEGKSIDAFGHPLVGDVGSYLADTVRNEFGIKTRSEKPGILQRCSRALVSETDREEAFEVGRLAATGALNGDTGKMVAIKRRSSSPYTVEYESVPLDDVANVEHFMPDSFINEAGNGVTRAFIEYVRPLIGNISDDNYELPHKPAEVMPGSTVSIV